MAIKLAGFGSAILLDFFYNNNPIGIDLNQKCINSCFPSQFSSRKVSLGNLNVKNLSLAQVDNITKDFNKSFLQECKIEAVDYILIDFINERFPLVRLSDGSLLTYSIELKLSGFLNQNQHEVIEPHSREYFEIWAACWDRFVKEAQAASLINKIIINKIFWAKHTDLGTPLPSQYDEKYIYDTNVYLYNLYAYCSKDVATENFIEYYPSEFLAFSNHRWSITPFHLTPSLYHKMLFQLSSMLSAEY